MTARARLASLVGIALLGGLIAIPLTAVVSPAPFAARAYAAASSADLIVGLTNKAEAKAGKRISYTITVKNDGPSRAKSVEIVFKTSAALSKIRHKVTNGRCHRSPKRIECVVGSIKKGKTATATLSGVISKKIKKGTPVTNTVSVTSRTHLVNTQDDSASDNYQMGVPRVEPATPTPSPSSGNKIVQAGNAAAKVFSFGRSAVGITYVALAAGILWFVVGLTLRKISRGRRGVTDD